MNVIYICKKIDYQKFLGIYYVDYVIKTSRGLITKAQGFHSKKEAQDFKNSLS